MQSHTVRRITSAHAALSLHSLITRHLTARPSSLPQVGGSVSSRRQIQLQRLSNGTLTQTVPNAGSTQPRPRLLKGPRTCIHHNRACIGCVRAWRCS
jgi:hypothetical protein